MEIISQKRLQCYVKADSRPQNMSELLLVITLFLLDRRHSDAVQITLAALRYPAAALLLILLENTNALQGLEDLAVDGARGVNVMRRP